MLSDILEAKNTTNAMFSELHAECKRAAARDFRNISGEYASMSMVQLSKYVDSVILKKERSAAAEHERRRLEQQFKNAVDQQVQLELTRVSSAAAASEPAPMQM